MFKKKTFELEANQVALRIQTHLEMLLVCFQTLKQYGWQ